jgi:hypothetical protein
MKRLALVILIALFALSAFSQENLSMKFYLAPQITEYDPNEGENVTRNILNDLIDIHSGDWFSERSNPARHISLCLVHASAAAHNAIIADGRSVLLTPIDILDDATMKQVLDAPFSQWPTAFITAAQNGLEANGISVVWVTSTNSLRDVLRYLLRGFVFAQIADYDGISRNSQLLAFLSKNLTDTVGSLTAQQRAAAKNWMASKGLDSAWITNATTVRQVVHYVIENLGFGKISFERELF